MIKLNFDDYDWSRLVLSKKTRWDEAICKKEYYPCFERRANAWDKVKAGSYNTIYFSDLIKTKSTKRKNSILPKKTKSTKKEEFDLKFDDMWG